MHSDDSHKRDFSANARLPGISALAAVIGALATLAAFVLLSLGPWVTNLFFFGQFSFADRSPALNTLGPWVIVVPVIGGLIVGMMARFGSEKIRGHGIPEAIEAILFGKSRRLRGGRHEALDHDREDRAARLPHLSRVRRRSARTPLRR
jgi:H+/Cl- antiporter ClcA